MRLVMICLDREESTRPIEYESVEKAYKDFEEKVTKAIGKNPSKRYFTFAGFIFNIGDYASSPTAYYRPEFLTVDQWFEQYGVKAPSLYAKTIEPFPVSKNVYTNTIPRPTNS